VAHSLHHKIRCATSMKARQSIGLFVYHWNRR